MTAAQMKKLDTIIGKIEALQNQLGPDATQAQQDALRVAKDRLLRILV
jgi:hypothetical protein